MNNKIFLLGALLLLLPGAVGHTFAQGGRLTPFQESYLRQLFFARSNVYEAAAVNAASWTNWYHGNSNLWDYMLGRTNDWNIGVTNLPPNWLSVSNWAAIGLTNLPPNWSTLSNAWTIGQTNLPGNWLAVSNAAINPAITGVAWVASNQVFTGTNGFTNGLDVYVAGSSPPTHSAAWRLYATTTAGDTNPVILLHMNGTDGAVTFTDAGVHVHAGSAQGGAQIDTAQYKFGGASGLFDGGGDYVRFPHSTDFDFGSGNFTVEFWARLVDVTAKQYVIGSDDTTGGRMMMCFNNVAGEIGLGRSGVGWPLRFAGNPMVNATWAHVALTRYGNTNRCFVNGAQVGTNVIDTTAWSSSATYLYVGGQQADPMLNGWLDDVRWSKGVALYTNDFTPSVSEFADPSAAAHTLNAISPDGTTHQILPETNTSGTLTTPNEYGIWGLDSQTNLRILNPLVSSRAGYWTMTSGYAIVVCSSTGIDPWWTTNMVGELIPRSF